MKKSRLLNIFFLFELYSLSYAAATLITVVCSMLYARGDFMVLFPHNEWVVESILGIPAIIGIFILVWRLIKVWGVLLKGSSNT